MKGRLVFAGGISDEVYEEWVAQGASTKHCASSPQRGSPPTDIDIRVDIRGEGEVGHEVCVCVQLRNGCV
jgi:hypothetical protein